MNSSSNYFDQLQAEMVKLLPTRSRREKNVFASLDVAEQAWRFMNWQSRLIHPHPRIIHKATGFDELPLATECQQSVTELLEQISAGADLLPYLSEDVMQGYVVHPPSRKDGPDFDLLLNEWGVHHLHIDHTFLKRGFKKRTELLLYAIFKIGVAFVLAVAPHKAWTDKELIEAALRSWPEEKLFVALNVLPGRDWTEDERKGLRKAGVTTAAVLNNSAWISGMTGGITTALVSLKISREASRILRCLHQATEHPEHLLKQFEITAATNGISLPTQPSVSLRFFQGHDRYCFGFIEEATELVVLI